MRWYSSDGEYAFFAVGSVARGVIAVGGVAHGILAIGAFASVGVISIGMNAIGSVLAVGLNAAGPIALSLINAVGFFVVAGVNGLGARTHAGTNAVGLSASGGVNSNTSVVPALAVIALGLVLSSVFRGKRERSKGSRPESLPAFLRGAHPTEVAVVADLSRIGDGELELAEGAHTCACRAEPLVLEQARSLAGKAATRPARVLTRLLRAEEDVPDVAVPEAGYRERLREIRRGIVLCLGVEAAPPEETWLPKDAEEMQWVVAWSTRVAVVAMALALLAQF